MKKDLRVDQKLLPELSTYFIKENKNVETFCRSVEEFLIDPTEVYGRGSFYVTVGNIAVSKTTTSRSDTVTLDPKYLARLNISVGLFSHVKSK